MEEVGLDEDMSKPSMYKQWQEKCSRPTIVKHITRDSIEDHRKNLVACYKCPDDDIYYKFQKIANMNDEDRDNCLLLTYYLRRQSGGSDKEIFSHKIPLPEELRLKAEQFNRERPLNPGVPTICPPQDVDPVQPRSKLRKRANA